jgi:hypothetical protein
MPMLTATITLAPDSVDLPMSINPTIALRIASVALLTSGCADNPSTNQVPVFPVTGTITLNGAPLASASVVFEPHGPGLGAAGFTDSSGQFVLRTYQPSDGAPAGDFVVIVQKTVMTSVASAPLPEFKSTQEIEDWKLKNNIIGRPLARSIIPEVYTSAVSSPLRAVVVAGQKNEFIFELKN